MHRSGGPPPVGVARCDLGYCRAHPHPRLERHGDSPREDRMRPHGNKDSWLAALDAEGTAFRDAAAQGDPGARVPTCPEGNLRDLIVHLAAVFSRIGRYATMNSTERPDPPL